MDGPDDQGQLFSGWELWYLVPVAFFVAVLAVGALAVSTLNQSESQDAVADAPANLPPYWTVKEGDTYAQIAEKTGLTVDQLETFNPRANPSTIRPGQKLKLRLHVPAPPPPPLGPKWWTVRAGQSYGSIAAATGKPIARLIRLNRRLKPTELRPGNRVRLRR